MRNNIWHSIMEIIGRPFYSILISATMFLLVSFCAFATFLNSAISSFYNTFADISGYSIVTEIDGYSKLENWSSILKKTKQNKHIIAYNNGILEIQKCTPINFYNVPYKGAELTEDSINVYLIGDINTQYNDYFRNEHFQLVKGKFPTDDEPGIIIDEYLANSNGVSIGDSLQLDWNGHVYSFSITGLYKTLQSPQIETYKQGYYTISPNSFLFCNYTSYVELTGILDCRIMKFYVDNYNNMQQSCEYIANLVTSIDNSLVMDAISTQEIQMSEVILLLKQMSTFTINSVYILCIIVMSLLIILWLRSHSQMIAIYKILGEQPFHIIGKLLIEILILIFPTAGLSTLIYFYFIKIYSKQIFLKLVEFFEITSTEQNFSANIWNFEMNQTLMIQRIILLQIVILLIVTLVSRWMVYKPVRKLKKIE